VISRSVSVGFVVPEPDAVGTWVQQLAAQGAVQYLADGSCVARVHDEASGARLTVVVGRDGTMRSARPSFRAEQPCRIRARVTGLLPDGADPDADAVQLAPQRAGYPLAVEFEDGGRAIGRLPFGEEVDVELVGFAHTMECYPHADAYRSSGIPLRIREVLPAGLVPLPGTDDAPRSRATALVSGVVMECRRLHNALGGGTFLHLVVDTDGMVFDAVVRPEVVEGPPVEPGRIVTGAMWFVARCPEPATAASVPASAVATAGVVDLDAG